ncbi:MAG: UDP-glucose/GDP-mannose dehydrogenase family protein [Rhodocyclaceae bacterium]|nr:UDP-glucose/GDP-mannose dehydrogenase family protein [Rhodocyclaceae bacterium]
MKICVLGLWHLGSVTAACSAQAGHQVIGLDSDETALACLAEGRAPLYEPGLDALLQKSIQTGQLAFTSIPADALATADVLWVCFDTPVNDDDQADVSWVETKVQEALMHLQAQATVLVSSQLPIGTISRLEAFARQTLPHREIEFACSPENLRLGKSIDVFMHPDRVVIGVRSEQAREKLQQLFTPLTDRIEWMSIESAEMTKHAINAFLATSVTFANEIAALCELTGADAKEVERGLKTESRIGPKAYLSPGGAFAGGTLARDIGFLCDEATRYHLDIPLMASVKASNTAHKGWVYRKLSQLLGTISGKTIAVWGLTYKPGTDTLRRSLAVEYCNWLIQQEARVRVFDPVVKALPPSWEGKVAQCDSALSACRNADALIIGTEWPEFRDCAMQLPTPAVEGTPPMLIIDANRHLYAQLGNSAYPYVAVGTSLSRQIR